MTLQALGVIAIVLGIALEILMIGSELGLGTAIAALGIVVFVFGLFHKREHAKREKRGGP